jgi:hypothetical protein
MSSSKGQFEQGMSGATNYHTPPNTPRLPARGPEAGPDPRS